MRGVYMMAILTAVVMRIGTAPFLHVVIWRGWLWELAF